MNQILMSVSGAVGESSFAGQIGKIVLASCSVGFGRANDPNSNLPFGALLQRQLHITKRIDTSTGFMGNLAASNGPLQDGAFVVFREVFGTSVQDVCQMTLVSARVEYHEVSFNSGGDDPVEALRISFGQLVVKTFQRSATGALIGTSSFGFKAS